MYGPMTVKEATDQADRATKAGRYDEAEALIDRAKAIKENRLEAFENQATAAMLAPEYAKAIAADRRWSARVNTAVGRAIKSANLAELGPDVQKLGDELHGGNYSQASYDKMRSYVAYLKGAPLTTVRPQADAVVLSPAQLLDAVQSGMDASAIKATLISSQDSQGGFLTAGVISEQILGRASGSSVVRSRATVDSPGAGQAIGFPVWQGSGDLYTSGLRGHWTSEVQALTGLGENPTIGLVKPSIGLWRLKVLASKSLSEDGGARMVANLNAKFAEAIQVDEDRAELTGSGVNEPLGVFASSAGVLLNPDVRVTNSGAANTITGDGIVSMLFSLPGQYRNAPGFCVTCNAATLRQVRLLKDQAGRYLIDDKDHTLCGYPLAESEAMPDIAASSFPIGCGDFAGYCIADALGLSIQRYDDSLSSETDSVVFYIRRRVGAQPAEGYRFAALKVSA